MELPKDDESVWLQKSSDFIEDFAVPSERTRLQYLLSKPKRRQEVLSCFHTDVLFDARYLHRTKSSHAQESVDEAEKLMKKLDATSRCFAFSSIESLGGETDLKAALQDSVGFCRETILYCSQPKVAYWEGGHCDRWVLCKS